VNSRRHFPSTPGGKLLSEWVRLFNDGNPERLEAFVQAHYGESVLHARPPRQVAEGQRHNQLPNSRRPLFFASSTDLKCFTLHETA